MEVNLHFPNRVKVPSEMNLDSVNDQVIHFNLALDFFIRLHDSLK